MASSLPKGPPPMTIPQIQLNGVATEEGPKPTAPQPQAVVYNFDADATPQQKAAVAGRGAEKLKSVGDAAKPSGTALPVDDGKGLQPEPTVKSGDDQEASETETSPTPPPVEDPIPGDLPVGPARPIPDWFRIGWRQASGIDDPLLPEGEEKDKGILAQHLNEMYYGEWYHNAAIIFAAVFVTHLMTLLRMGWGWIFILLAFCASYYSTSVERMRRRARDDIQRELTKNRLDTGTETADWLNNFLSRFWMIYEPVLSATIISSVDQILSISTPSFLDSIRMTTFTLGTKAPKVDHVRTYPRTPDDIVTMDWSLSFIPNDVSDITPRQAALKTNPKIVLEIRLGKGLATAGIPILVEDISFAGNMQIKMKLMTNFPHVQIVDISFLQQPEIDYVLKPLGGETFGMDIASIPGLSGFIRDMVHATLGPMMYAPNVFTLNLEQLLSGKPLDTAIGVVQVIIHAARGLKGTKIGGGTPDPYVSININGRKELERTKYKSDTYNPTWSEVKYILVNNLTEQLNFVVMDYNEHRKDHELGSASFDLLKLQDDTTHENLVEKVLKDGKDRGELRFDISYFPVLVPTMVEGVAQPLPNTTAGIVRLVIHQAKELDATKSMSGELNPLARVFLGPSSTKPIHSTLVFKHTNNPVWESPIEFLCPDRQSSAITVKVIDDRDFLKDPLVGYITIKLEDLLQQTSGQDWWPLSGCKTGRIRMSAQWKPLEMAGSLHGAGSYVPPIGIVRLLLQKAADLKNVEAALGGKSDPYTRVLVGDSIMGRTEVVNNNLSPVWDQFLYIPVHSLKETLFLECMDYQHLTKDRSLGTTEILMADLAKPSSDQRYPYESLGKKVCADMLRLDKSDQRKGTLHYTAEFIPAFHLKGLTFNGAVNQIQRALEEVEESGDVIGDDETSLSSSDEELQKVPDGITTSKSHAKGARSTDTTATVKTVKTMASASSVGGSVAGGSPLELSREEILQSSSGIVIFDVVSGQLAKKGRLEILMDDGYWPVFSTTKARSTTAKWDQVGEGFIKELQFGRVWLRINENSEGEKESIVADFKCDARAFLEKCLNKETTFTLEDINAQNQCMVQISSKFVPVPIKLEPRESFNNQGLLRVELIDGKDIHGVDRSGKSDPYVVFTLNGEKVYKSEVIKKTLTPVWNEKFEVMVPTRVGADFFLEIFDWNQIEKDKSIGSTRIELADLEPFEGVRRSIPLASAKRGDGGEIRLQLLFEPTIIMKTRKNTSVPGGRSMTQVIPPFVGGKGMGPSPSKGVKSLFKKETKSAEDPPQIDPSLPQVVTPDELSNGETAFPQSSSGQSPPPSIQQIGAGTLRVTVISAKDLFSDGEMVKPYVVLKLGEKEHKTNHVAKTSAPEWDESFSFIADPDTPLLHASLFDHKTFGKDRHLGEIEIDIWRYLQPTSAAPISAADVTMDIKEGQGQGQLRMRLEFERGALGSRALSGSIPSLTGRPSMSRFSPRRKIVDE